MFVFYFCVEERLARRLVCISAVAILTWLPYNAEGELGDGREHSTVLALSLHVHWGHLRRDRQAALKAFLLHFRNALKMVAVI